MSEAAPAEPKKSAMPPSRIAVIAFVVIAAIVVIFELRARLAWDSTYKAVQAAMDESPEGLLKKDLDQHLSGSFSREENKQSNTELFTWSGLLRSYRMRLSYGPGEMIIALDDQPQGD